MSTVTWWDLLLPLLFIAVPVPLLVIQIRRRERLRAEANRLCGRTAEQLAEIRRLTGSDNRED